MKFEINIKKNYFFSVLAVVLIFGVVIGVYAFSPSGSFTKTKSQATALGHSSDEIVVNIGGVDYTLQDAISQGKLSALSSGSITCSSGQAIQSISSNGTATCISISSTSSGGTTCIINGKTQSVGYICASSNYDCTVYTCTSSGLATGVISGACTGYAIC